MASDSRPELFQVTVVFGNFEDRQQAADFREEMEKQYSQFISGRIRGSFS